MCVFCREKLRMHPYGIRTSAQLAVSDTNGPPGSSAIRTVGFRFIAGGVNRIRK
jgi:hypothetical protein